jgi:hypothetical protein
MGDSKRIQRGKDIFIWSTAGIIMIASSYILVTAIFNAVLTGSASDQQLEDVIGSGAEDVIQTQ